MTSLMTLLVAAVLAVATSPEGGGDVPRPDRHIMGGFTGASPTAPDTLAAAQQAVKLLGTATWLGAPHTTLVKVLSVQRQVVAGLNYKFELLVAQGNVHRFVRLVMYKDLRGGFALTNVVLSRPGDLSEPVEPGANAAPGTPGGYRERVATDADVAAAIQHATQLLGTSAWLNHPVLITHVDNARSQVVAGTNWAFELEVKVGNVQRQLELVLFEGLHNNWEVSYLHLLPPTPTN